MCKTKKKKYVRIKGFLDLKDMPKDRRVAIMESMREHHVRVCQKYLGWVDDKYDEEQSIDED